MKRTKTLLFFTVLCLLLTGCQQSAPSTISDTIPPAAATSGADSTTSTPTPSGYAAKLESVQDAVAWLQLDGTNIDNAVMQGEDNDYYLHRDETGQKSAWGCYYMDYECTTNPMSKNIIIYGHSDGDADNGERFSELKMLLRRQNDAFQRKIVLATEKIVYTYEVFSCGFAAADTETVSITANPDRQTMQEIIDLAYSRSLQDFGVEVTPEDTLLTLSTCTSDDGVRYVVVAKLVAEEAV